MMSATKPQSVAAKDSTGERINARNWLALIAYALTFHLPMTSVAPSETLEQVTIKKADVPRFRKVHSYFWRGASPSYAGMDILKQLGVKTIVDLRRQQDVIEAERAYCAKLGIRYVNLPMGNFIPSIDKQATFLSLVGEAAGDPAKAPVFLHCSHGSDRTGYLTALWRVQHDNWCPLEATSEMLRYGFLLHKLDRGPSR
jgi:protein tyrosine/serine phosphatase